MTSRNGARGRSATSEKTSMAEADIERMLDLATPWCLRVAATLRIPGHIAAGHVGIADLAAAAGCDPDALHAVLGHLVSQGVFTEESPGRFACNQAAEQLAGVPFLDLAGIGGRMAHTWGTLLDFVRTGLPAYQQVFGRPFWEDLAAHPAIGAEFDALMGPAGHGVPDFDVELSDGWDAVRTIVDVGGGTGAMLASLLRRHPRARGILVDQDAPRPWMAPQQRGQHGPGPAADVDDGADGVPAVAELDVEVGDTVTGWSHERVELRP